MLAAALAAVAGSLLGGGGVATFLTLRPQNAKTRAEAGQIIAETWELLVRTYAESEARCQQRLSTVEARIDQLVADLGQQWPAAGPPPPTQTKEA
jgi:hypothetical protein